jgi:hypothetical protein
MRSLSSGAISIAYSSYFSSVSINPVCDSSTLMICMCGNATTIHTFESLSLSPLDRLCAFSTPAMMSRTTAQPGELQPIWSCPRIARLPLSRQDTSPLQATPARGKVAVIPPPCAFGRLADRQTDRHVSTPRFCVAGSPSVTVSKLEVYTRVSA